MCVSVVASVTMPKVDTRLPISTETRDEILFPLKEPGESYDDLVRRLASDADEYQEDG